MTVGRASDEYGELETSYEEVEGVVEVRLPRGDKEVMRSLGGQGGVRGACKVLGWLLEVLNVAVDSWVLPLSDGTYASLLRCYSGKSIFKRYIDTKPNHELIHYCLENPPYELGWKDKEVPTSEGSHIIRTERVNETYKNVSQEIRDQLNAEAEAVQIILTGIDNDIYSTVDACPNACEMWKEIKRFYKIRNELIRNQCKVTNHQVNVQFLLQLQTEWQRFVTLVKQSQELKTASYHKLYDILKQHQHEVNEIRSEKIARVANPLALIAQQQPVYHPQNHPTHYTQNSSTESQQAVTRNKGKAIINSPQPIYDQEPLMVAEDDETSKDKEIDKLMALISLSFKKIYKPTNNNL
nr:hypothetical protein [Tanacetum cinerariifolium]